MSVVLPGLAVAIIANQAAFTVHDLECALDDIRVGRVDEVLTKRIERAISFAQMMSGIGDP